MKKIVFGLAIVAISLFAGDQAFADEEGGDIKNYDTDTCAIALPTGGVKTGSQCSVACYFSICPCSRVSACH